MGIFDWVPGRYQAKLTDGGFWAHWFGGDTWAGKPVTPDTALQLSTYWACVRLISETVATLPLGLYSLDKQRNKTPATDHPLYSLLHDSPNADQTALEFWEGQVAALCTVGNGYSEKMMTGRRLTSLEPLQNVAVRRDQGTGDITYTYTDRGKQETLPSDKVFHIRGWGGGIEGLSPVSYSRQTLSLASASEEAAGKTFSQGMRASGFFQAPAGVKLTQEQRDQFKKSFIDPYVGNDARLKVGLLEAGFQFTPVNISPHDAELLLTRRFNVEEICRFFGVPPIMIGHSSPGTTMFGAGVEQIMQGWLNTSLRNYLKRIEQAIKKRLMLPEERANLTCEFTVEELLRADHAARAEFYSKMVQNGIMSRNRVRQLENEPKVASKGADSLTVQSNLIPIDDLGVVASLPRIKDVVAGAELVPTAADPTLKPGAGVKLLNGHGAAVQEMVDTAVAEAMKAVPQPVQVYIDNKPARITHVKKVAEHSPDGRLRALIETPVYDDEERRA